MNPLKLYSRVEITTMFGFQRSTFANFRRNYPDFPAPKSARGNAPLFDLDEVAEFLFNNAPQFLTKTPDGMKYAARFIQLNGITD